MAKFLTTIGINKLLSASPLDPIEIKSLVVGTGTGSATQSITELFNEVYRGNASDPIKNGAKLGFTTVIPLEAGSWSLTEWGWIDKDGDLIAYGQFDNPVYKEAGSMTLEPTLYIELSNSTDSQMFITDVLNFPHNQLTGRNEADAHNIASITGLQTALNNTVKTSGNQSIEGVKIFAGTVRLTQLENPVANTGISMSNNGVMRVGGVLGFSISQNDAMIDFDQNLEMYGNGKGLTNLNASYLASGTVPVARLPSASTTAKGAVQLNNTLTSTSTALALTASQGKVLNDQAFGVGQTWQNVTTSRVANTVYTNSTTKAIFISIRVLGGYGFSEAVLYVDDKIVSAADPGTSDYSGMIYAIVNPGSTYKVIQGTALATTWMEYR